MRKGLISLLLVGVAFTWAGCSSLQEDLSAPLSSDQALAREVDDRLDQDTVTGMQTFVVTAHDGVVTLQGIVARDAIRFRAEAIAREVPGVERVENRILLR